MEKVSKGMVERVRCSGAYSFADVDVICDLAEAVLEAHVWLDFAATFYDTQAEHTSGTDHDVATEGGAAIRSILSLLDSGEET